MILKEVSFGIVIPYKYMHFNIILCNLKFKNLMEFKSYRVL